MKIIETVNGNEIERLETRDEVKARHALGMDLHRQGMELLESIHAEEPYFNNVKIENEKADRVDRETKRDEGLTTEINTSQTLVNVGDTVENCRSILARHPYGFRDGDAEGTESLTSEKEVETEQPAVKVDPYAGKKPILKNGKLIWVAE